jgi:hypothetical protein
LQVDFGNKAHVTIADVSRIVVDKLHNLCDDRAKGPAMNMQFHKRIRKRGHAVVSAQEGYLITAEENKARASSLDPSHGQKGTLQTLVDRVHDLLLWCHNLNVTRRLKVG